MTPVITPAPTLDLANSIRQLHRRLDFDLTFRFLPDAKDCEAVTRFLASKCKASTLKVLARRAQATVRLLEASRYV